MKVIYNVKYKSAVKENGVYEELKQIFNQKLLNVIMNLENESL